MAGITRIYCIGAGGEGEGGEGPNPILVQIWRGDGKRQWYEARYFMGNFSPIGKVRAMIPANPEAGDNLLDACILFFPEAFRGCPSFGAVATQLEEAEHVDFELGDNVPEGWEQLREEAREPFRILAVWTGGSMARAQGWEQVGS